MNDDEMLSNVATKIVKKFDGAANLRNCLVHATGRNLNLTTVYRWTYPVSKGGTGGVIPGKWLAHVQRAARLGGLYLSEEDFVDTRRQERNVDTCA